MSDDFSGDIATNGTVAVGGTAEGNIDSNGDRDWFEVELVAGRTYTIDLRGSPTDDGTLSDPRLYGIHDAAGNLLSGTTNDDWGGTYNSQVTFTASASGTYYIAAGAYGSNRGTYELEVTDKSAADDTRAGATDLGDITELVGPRFPLGTVDADADGVDYYRFTLTEAKKVGLGLRRQDANADLFLEDADGTVLYRSTNSGTANEAIEETLLAGTYYVRVQSQEAGENAHVVRYGVSAPDADDLAALQQPSDAVTSAAPAFGQQGYTFDLAENADGSTDRVSLGTVAATDPEGVSLAYSLVGDGGSFEIDGTSGELFYNGSGEDFESGTTQFTLTVRASDGRETVDTTVTVTVTDVEETSTQTDTSTETNTLTPTDADSARAGATDLGDITELQGPRFPLGTVDGGADGVDYYRFTLMEAKKVGLGLRQQDANADLFLEDADGTVRYSSTNSGTSNERIAETLLAGTYYLRVESREAGENAHVVRYGVSAPDADDLAALRQQSDAVTNAAPAFGQQGYTFDLAENADGSTNRVSLGTVAATDPEGVNLAYSLVGASGSFEIDETSGELFYKGSGEDYESDSTSYELTVRASDGSETVDTTVTVNVTDVAETADPPASDEDEDEESGTPETVSEPGDEDFSADTSTAGRVVVGETATGDIGTQRDRDWFAVELVAGREYQIDLRGRPTGDGTLSDPRLYGVHDAAGNQIARTTNDDWGGTYNSQVTFTATASGTHYIEAGAFGSNRGTYELEVTDKSPADTDSQPDTTTVVTTNAAPTFGQHGYTFDLAENADGSTDRVSLGTVSATDPEGVSLAYSLVGASGSFEIDETSGELFYTGSGEDYESDTTSYELTVRASDGSEIVDTTVTVNVTDVDETPAIRVADAEATEGDDTEMVFRVMLESASSGTVTVNYATADGTATAGEDYTATSGTLTFAPGETEKTVSVAIVDDTVEDSGETFRLVLSDPSGATLADSDAVGTILNTETADPPAADEDEDEESSTPQTVSEPDDEDFSADTSTAGQVAVGGTVTGKIETPDDIDWFAVTAKIHTYYRIDLKGLSTDNGTLANPHLYGIYDSGGNRVNYVSEVLGTGHDKRMVYFPLRGDVPPSIETTTFYIAVGGAGSATGTYRLSVEPDDFKQNYYGSGQTGLVEEGGSDTGNIESPGDQDWFVVHMERGVTYQIDLEGSGTNALSNPYLRGIYSRDGNLIAGYTDDDGGTGLNSRATFTATEDTYYYVAAGANGDSTGTYMLSVTETSRTIPTPDNPSDDFLATTATNGTVTAGGRTGGQIEVAQDQDWFAVTLEAGAIYQIDLKGSGTDALSNPYLRGIYDAAGNRIGGTSGNKGSGTDALSDSYLRGIYDAAGNRIGGTSDNEGSGTDALSDPYLRGIYDAAGNLIGGTSDNDDDRGRPSRVTFTAPEDGTYYVAAGGYRDTTGTYTLSVGVVSDSTTDDFIATVPDGTPGQGITGYISGVSASASATGRIEAANDQDWFYILMEPGATYQIDLEGSGTNALSNPYLRGIYDRQGNLIAGYADDDSGLGLNSRVTFTATERARYYLAAGANGDDTGDYTLAVTHISRAVETPPADVSDDFASTTANPGTVTVGGSATGEIDFSSDQDWFAVTLEAGTTYRIDLMGSLTDDGTLRDPYLRGIYNADGELISGTLDNNSGWSLNSRVTFTATEDGTHYVSAGAFVDSTGTYTLEVVEDTI